MVAIEGNETWPVDNWGELTSRIRDEIRPVPFRGLIRRHLGASRNVLAGASEGGDLGGVPGQAD